jgi:hypothetical protein
MKLFHNLWYRCGTPPWVRQARSDLVRVRNHRAVARRPPNVRNRALIEFESASMKGASAEGLRHGAGDENRTRMTSLEGRGRCASKRALSRPRAPAADSG